MKNRIEELKNELQEKKEIYLTIKVHAGAKNTGFSNVLSDGTIKLDVSTVPEKGKANLALLKFLAQVFGVAKNRVEIISGQSNKHKLVKIIK